MNHRYNINVRRGDTWRFVFRYLNPDRTSIDLDGDTIVFKINKRDKVVLEREMTVGDEITLHLTPSETASLSSGVYEITRILPSGDAFTLLAGRFTLEGWD